MQALRKWLRVGAAALAVAAVFAYFAVSYEIAVGVTKAERKPFEDEPGKHSLAYQDVTFPSREKGIVLSAWHIGADPAKPAVIFVHGIDSQRADDNSVVLAGRLLEEGYSVLLFDLRGHGQSGDGRISAGYYERQDVLGAFDYLMEQGVPAERIGLLGFSMGGAIAIMTAADEPRIRAVAVDSTFASARELIAQEVDRKTPVPERVVPVFLPTAELLALALYGIRVSALAPEVSVKQLDYPIYLLHGDADTRIPIAHSVRVHKAAPKGSVFWQVPGVEHVEAFDNFPDEYVERIAGYFAERLGMGTPAPVP